MARYSLCRISYQKELPYGSLAKLNEAYLVDSVNYTEAEARIHKELESTIREFNIVGITPARLTDVFEYPDGEIWWKMKIVYLSVVDRSGKEKKVNNSMMVNAATLRQAYDRIEESLKSMIVPYDITKGEATSILEVFKYVGSDTPAIPANMRTLSEVLTERGIEKDNELKLEKTVSEERDAEVVSE